MMKLFSVTAGLAVAWIASIWTGNHDEFSRMDSLTFFAHCGAVLLVQFLVYALICRFTARKIVICTLNGIFCALNFYSLVLLHMTFVQGLGTVTALVLLAGLVCFFSLIFKAVSEMKHGYQLAGVVIAILLVQSVGVYAYNQISRAYDISQAPDISETFTFHKFEKTPNIYFVGFDSLIPPPIVKHFLNIDDLAYFSAIEDEGFRVIRNAFSEKVPTKNFFNTLVAMDIKYWRSVSKAARLAFDIGEMPAPFYELFRHNGYKTQFIYRTSYFGSQNRAGVDFYGIAQERGICFHIDKDLAFMGYCLPQIEAWRAPLTSHRHAAYPEFLFNRIREVAKSDAPWLTIAHIYNPGHTLNTFNPYDPEEFVKFGKRLKKKAPSVATQIRTLVETIRTHDPGAVLIISGDHGSFMSRGLYGKKELPADSPMTAKEVYQDLHAVQAAIWPKDFCLEEFGEPYSMTRTGRSLVKCLSGGKDPLPPDYWPNDDHLKEYAYE